MPASSRFIWAICSSYSKSLTARRPLTITGIVVGAAVVDEQALEAVDPDVGQVGDGVAQQLHALLDREQPGLARVDQHRHDQLVVEPGGPVDDVDVAVGDRVERTGTDGTSHGERPYRSRASPYRRSRSPSRGVGHSERLLAAGRAPPRARRPGASQPPAASAPSTSSTSSTGVAYGGSASTRSKAARRRPGDDGGHRAGDAPARRAARRRRGSPAAPAAPAARTRRRPPRRAPRDSASSPSAPEPA